MDLSIIIVNWNSKDYLRACLASILAETRGLEYEIIVIDSASFDGCDQMLGKYYPGVRFIQAKQNLGFAKANNVAVQASTGRWVLFLNPDTELVGPAINTLYEELLQLPNAGAVGSKHLHSDHTILPTSVRSLPTILNQVLDSNLLRTRLPRCRLWGAASLYDESIHPTEVEAISGACIMLPRAKFEEAGRFSEEYFMYSEDMDLCHELRRLGYRNYYVPSAVIVHHSGASSSQSQVNTFSTVMMLESRWRFFNKTRSSMYSLLYRVAMCQASVVRLSIAAVACWIAGGARWEAALKKWTAGLRWSLGMEKWVQKYPEC